MLTFFLILGAVDGVLYRIFSEDGAEGVWLLVLRVVGVLRTTNTPDCLNTILSDNLKSDYDIRAKISLCIMEKISIYLIWEKLLNQAAIQFKHLSFIQF